MLFDSVLVVAVLAGFAGFAYVTWQTIAAGVAAMPEEQSLALLIMGAQSELHKAQMARFETWFAPSKDFNSADSMLLDWRVRRLQERLRVLKLKRSEALQKTSELARGNG